MQLLNKVQRDELWQWLIDLNFNPYRVHHEFSNAVPLAQLLKLFYPRMVEMHNYPMRCSTAGKKENWIVLNNKILSKLGLRLTDKEMQALAKATPGFIDVLLFKVMRLTSSSESKHEVLPTSTSQSQSESSSFHSMSDCSVTVLIHQREGNTIRQVPQKMVPYLAYEQIQKESSKKDALVLMAQQSIMKMRSTLNRKEERIRQLTSLLARMSVDRQVMHHTFY